MKKYKSYFYPAVMALLTCGAFTACSSDETLEENAKQNQVYFQVSFNMQGTGTGTRGGEETQTTTVSNGVTNSEDYDSQKAHEATEEEYAPNKLDIYFFNASTGKFVDRIQYITTSDQFTNNNDGSYTTPAKAIAQGAYHVYMVLNDNQSEVSGTTISTENDIKHLILSQDYALSSSDYLMMSGRTKTTINNQTEYRTYVYVDLNSSNYTATNPYSIAMDMERVHARIGYASSTCKFDAANASSGYQTNIASIELTGYKILNERNQFYLHRHVGTSYNTYAKGTDAFSSFLTASTGTYPYVVVPQATDESSILETQDDFQTLKAESLMGYCAENVLEADNQLMGNVTAIMFEAKITPNSDCYHAIGEGASSTYTEGNDLYYYNGVFSNSPTYFGSGITESNYENAGIHKYTGGIGYYYCPIRHYDNGDSEKSGVMEFAIVRNNAYQIDVQSVSLPARDSGNLTTEEESLPVEMVKSNINAKITILPWVLRTNTVNLGQ